MNLSQQVQTICEARNIARRQGVQGKGHLVFVYGSLLRGLHNHDVLGDGRFVSQATIPKSAGLVMMQIYRSYPHVMKASAIDQQPQAIKGEVYRVNSNDLEDLDALEGVPAHYQRLRLGVDIPEKGTVQVFTYIAADPADYKGMGEVVPHGDWKRHYEAQKRQQDIPTFLDDEEEDEKVSNNDDQFDADGNMQHAGDFGI